MSDDKYAPAGAIASSLVVTGAALLTLDAEGKPGLHLWSEEEIDVAMRRMAAKKVRAYAQRTHNHVVLLTGACAPALGDRCDITAALRAAADEIEKCRERRPGSGAPSVCGPAEQQSAPPF